MVQRSLASILKQLALQMPVVSLTGPRQSGKSTLAREVFKTHTYVNLEDLEKREFARQEPKAFLDQYPWPLVIDEAQYAPDLFSYIQLRCDEEGAAGMYVVTGSQDFLLARSVSQSLAGRVAILHLLPFSMKELESTEYACNTWAEYVYKGFYPRIYDKNLDPHRWYGDYVKTYLERDVREIVNVGDLRSFHQFLMLCAGRVGQLLNLSSISNDVGVSYQTIKRWISVLEMSSVVTLLQPYHRNMGKRTTKSPKLYFNDPGLASFLLGIRSERDVLTHYARGQLFENLIISELTKQAFNQGEPTGLFFWRDSSGLELDCLKEARGSLYAIEIKSGSTFSTGYIKGIQTWLKLADVDPRQASVVFGGDLRQVRNDISILPWNQLDDLPFLSR